MSRTAIPFAVDDVSALAKSLNAQLESTPEKPGHLALLNMLARGAGYKNFQHLRSTAEAEGRLSAATPQIPAAPVDYAKVEKIARYFDADGVLMRWPGKDSHRLICLWVLWSRIAPRRSYDEKAINALLNAHHRFGDHALLRRDMVDRGMLDRTRDGREYKRLEVKPPAEAVALIRALHARAV